MDTALGAISAHVFGRVQGVGFRAWTRRQAEELGLSGWVANEADGSVRAMFSGSENAVALIAEALKKGPEAARVSNVVIVPVEPDETRDGFRIFG